MTRPASKRRSGSLGVKNITGASESGVLRPRVDDLVAGLGNPVGNERRLFLSGLLQAAESSRAPVLACSYTAICSASFRKEKRWRNAPAALTPPSSLVDRSSLFRDRGVALDTGILPDFSIDQALRDLKTRGELRGGQVARVMVIGPDSIH